MKFELAKELFPVSGSDAWWEAKLLLEYVDDDLERLSELVRRRLSGEPLQYILGEWTFYGLDFRVTPDVLIPRQESELLVELARERDFSSVLDLCCGSGCIGISTVWNLESGIWNLTLADISPEALTVAGENALRHGVKAELVQSDLFAQVEGTFDLILCNPPYLSADDMGRLQRELAFEPALALYGSEDGLAFYRRIAAEYRDYLAPDGVLLLEIGSTQAEAVCALFPGAEVYKDYAGLDRVVRVE
ncbi:MAG: peptide chain release factor N(5)-glutamine methyltransferase [Clostridiales bacterium]|nr:peptide chain release factor N(5)-glutamine methyltransferase [Clostridiales bacterium]